MQLIWIIAKRELLAYFATPIAYVFIVVFLLLSGFLTFYLGHFFSRGQADLLSFFTFHPWIYLFLIPALGMRLWSEERKSGSIELLLTLPVHVYQAVLGKYMASLLFTAFCLCLTFPMWILVNYLGDPDNGVIMLSYGGSLLLAGAYLAIASSVSAMTKNQVIAFVISLMVCLFFVFSGFPTVLEIFQGWLPLPVLSLMSSFSFLSHFETITKGVISLSDFFYFVSLTALWLFLNVQIVQSKKAS